MSKEYDYDPVNGSYTILEDNPSGGVIIHTKQDIKPAIDWATKQRNSGQNDLGGLRDKDDLKHYATIPLGAIMDMRKKGINVWDPNQTKEMIREIERNYPLCKVTNRKMM